MFERKSGDWLIIQFANLIYYLVHPKNDMEFGHINNLSNTQSPTHIELPK